MKALVKTRPGYGLELLEVPDPVPGRGEVLIRVEAAKVCGSDVDRFRWTRNYESGAAKAMTGDLPRIIGHEYAGTVLSLGSDVSGVGLGDRVAVRAMLGCGRCPECNEGLPNVCRDRKTLGVHRDGGFAERAIVPDANCHRIPDSMSFPLAAAITSFATATYAVQRAELEPGSRILIWGAGAIGLGAFLAARLRGIATGLVLDRVPSRLEVAASLGAETLDVGRDEPATLLLERLGARAVDAVIEAAGVPESIQASLPVLRKNRPMVLVGNMAAPVTAELMPLIMDQQRLVGSRSKSLAAWNLALSTIEQSGFERILPEKVAMADALARFEATANGKAGPFTILPN